MSLWVVFFLFSTGTNKPLEHEHLSASLPSWLFQVCGRVVMIPEIQSLEIPISQAWREIPSFFEILITPVNLTEFSSTPQMQLEIVSYGKCCPVLHTHVLKGSSRLTSWSNVEESGDRVRFKNTDTLNYYFLMWGQIAHLRARFSDGSSNSVFAFFVLLVVLVTPAWCQFSFMNRYWKMEFSVKGSPLFHRLYTT